MTDPSRIRTGEHPAEQHVYELLSLASTRHAEAIAAVSARPIDVERCREAEKQLADAEMLCSDAIDTLEDMGELSAIELDRALASLRDQRRMLAEGLAKLDAAKAVIPQPSPWSTPWPWLSLLFVALLAFGLIAGLAKAQEALMFAPLPVSNEPIWKPEDG